MEFEKHTPEDFIMDNRFRKWVMENDGESNAFWNEYLHENLEKKTVIIEAKKILIKLSDLEYKISKKNIERIWSSIEMRIDY